MHLVALVCSDLRLAQALNAFQPEKLKLYLHLINPGGDLRHAANALEPLEFAGMLVLDEALQQQALSAANRSSLGAQDAAVADTLTVTPGGLIAEYSFGRAVGAALQAAGWHGRAASAVILGSGPVAKAVSHELSSLGITRLAVLAANRPVAEMTSSRVAASTEIIAMAAGDPATMGLLEQTDLVVRIDSDMTVPSNLLGPHLTVVDLAPQALTKLRQQATSLGALSLGLRDVQAQQLTLSLGHILGGKLEASHFSELLHSL